jgi:hypothetical protein
MIRQALDASPAAILGGALLLVLGCLATFGGLQPLSHDDLFFHLRTGEIVLETRQVPTTDSFSFTRHGQPWVSHEWGFGVLMELVRRGGGLWSLVALGATTSLALVLTILSATRRSSRPEVLLATLPLLFVAVVVLAPELILRAALFSALLLALTVEALERFRLAPSWKRGGVIVLTVLAWANFHSGVSFGLWAVGLWSLQGCIAALRRPRSLSGLRRWLGLGLGCGLASLCNPNGLETPLYPLTIARLLRELRDVVDLAHYAPPTVAKESATFVLVLLLALAMVVRRRALASVPPARWALLATFLALGLTGKRFAPELVVVVTPIAGRLLGAWLPSRASSRSIAIVAISAAAWATTSLVARFDARELQSPIARHLPVAAAELASREGLLTHRFFNHQNYGGYLGWRLRKPVFWDGRTEVFGPIFAETARSTLPELSKRWDLESLIFAEHDWRTLAPQLQPAGWVPIYWDDFTAIAVKSTGPFAELATRKGLRLTPPFGGIPVSLAEGRPDLQAALERELRQVLTDAPHSQRAAYYLARVLRQQGRLNEARELLVGAVSVAPNQMVEDALAELQIELLMTAR